MYKSFYIENFRCFEKLKIENLKRVNLFAGLNNVGKTSLLEALFLHCGYNNPALVLNINALRGIDFLKVHFGQWIEAPWVSLFYNYDYQKEIKLQGKGDKLFTSCLNINIDKNQAKSRSIIGYPDSKLESTKIQSSIYSETEGHELKFIFKMNKKEKKYSLILDSKGVHQATPTNLFPAFFQGSRSQVPLAEEAERFSNLIKTGKLDSLIKVLKIIEPRLKKLELLVEFGTAMIFGDIGLNRLIPLHLMGEGTVKITNAALSIANAESGVVLIDEIENGIHHSNMEKVWAALNKISKDFNTQIFATTHSFECIKAAHNSFLKNKSYDLSLIRLERKENIINPVYYDEKTLSSAIEFGFEVR